MTVPNRAHELAELDSIRIKALVKYDHQHNDRFKPFIESTLFENFEGEFDIYEISYMKYHTVKRQNYLKAAMLRDLEKQILGLK